ncbi:MAG: sulfatase [Burkholderiales bacterium]|nr:sulfatase [Burkholderiales bacterium]
MQSVLPRHWIRWTVLTLLSLAACGGGGGANNTPPPPQVRANIVYIVADDLDNAATATMSRTQALIGDEGTRLEQHIIPISLCCPSRVSTLRGQFSHNSGIYTNGAPDGGFKGVYARHLEEDTVALWLQRAGYRTALMGKFLNGYPNSASKNYLPPGWTEFISPTAGTVSDGFNYTLNENGTLVSYGAAEADYMPDVLTAKAVDFITRAAATPSTPFFLYLAPYSPHSPATPAPRHANAYPGVTAPRTASFNEADVSDKPSWLRSLPLMDAKAIGKLDALYRKRLQSLLAIDEMVERVVDTLRSNGQLDNTYVIFTSDNGFHLGQHRLETGKATAFEEDIHVPFMVRGPGVVKGGRVRALTANVDHAPTFAAIAGATQPAWVDGRSLLPWWQGQTPGSWREAILLSYRPGPIDPESLKPGPLEGPESLELKLMAELVDQAFDGLRLADGRTWIEYANGERESYDLTADPDQLSNIAASLPADQVNRWQNWTAGLKASAGAALRDKESSPP